MMGIDMFREILDWAGKVRRVMLYVYSDACMHPDLHLFVQECTDRGIDSWISTMLQGSRCDFEKVIEARPTEFRISFPGWERMGYYQNPATTRLFDKKFKQVVRLPRHPETTWTMAYHLYNDNADEAPRAKALAEANGLKFVALPCIFMVGEKVVEKNYSEQDLEFISHLIETPGAVIAHIKKNDYCMMWKQITLDANGDIYLCQLLYEDRFRIRKYYGSFKYHTRATVEWWMKTHDFCKKCTASGMNVYQNCYSEFIKYADPVAHAEKRRSR
jgi:radical SAM protein with 4Fe4S-binding SPASM domain